MLNIIKKVFFKKSKSNDKISDLDKICSYIFHKNENIDFFKIHKLLYFIQAYHLVKYDKPAFIKKIVCGYFGAYVPSITKNKILNGKDCYKNNNYLELDIKIKNIIDEILKVFSETEALVLAGMTMQFIDFYNKKDVDICDVGTVEINVDEIKKIHSENLKNNGYIF